MHIDELIQAGDAYFGKAQIKSLREPQLAAQIRDAGESPPQRLFDEMTDLAHAYADARNRLTAAIDAALPAASRELQVKLYALRNTLGIFGGGPGAAWPIWQGLKPELQAGPADNAGENNKTKRRGGRPPEDPEGDRERREKWRDGKQRGEWQTYVEFEEKTGIPAEEIRDVMNRTRG